MNMFDRMIEAVSPRWAASRAYYRTILGAARAYDAAATGRRTDSWVAASTSANAEIGPALSLSRARSRELVRNNLHAARAARIIPAHLVGAGIIPRVSTADKKAKQAAREDWNAFVENCDPEGMVDFYGKLHQVARTILESGSALIQFLPRPASWKMRVPLQIQVLEPDYIDHTKTQDLDNGNVIIQGVEFDSYGRRVAYWMFDRHPGEMVSYRHANWVSRRVSAEFIRPVFEILRSGQVHGVPWLAPAVMKLRDTGDYDDAMLMKKKIEACFSVFVKRTEGAAASPLAGSKASTDSRGRRIEQLSPGRVDYLGLNEEVQFAEPPTVNDYADYMRTQMHAVAAGIGTTYESLTGDLSQVNYSSMRGGMLDFWALLDVWQWQMIIPQACAPVWRYVDRLLVASGRRADFVGSPIWTPPARRWIDPAKDVQAENDSIRVGLKTLPQAIAERGEDPDDVLDEIARTNAVLDDKKIVLDSDPRRVGKTSTPAMGNATQGDSNAQA